MNYKILALAVAPFLLLLAVWAIWKWRNSMGGLRAPTDEKLLRAPGEWLMEQQGEIELRLSCYIAAVLFGPYVIVAQAALFSSSGHMEISGQVIAICILVSLVAIYFLWKELDKSSNYRLGLMGERAVGEELNKLMLHGYHVYHDFKKDHNGNIDHVVVAPSGVYCIETKCRSKRKGTAGQREHEIIFDGEQLHYPHGADSYGVQQTLRNSEELARWLSSAVGERIAVKGILTFPGWYVTTRKTAKNLRVLNPKQIQTAIASDKEQVLDAKLTKRIVHQLEQRCRNVQM
jgi:hypothetical protein